ncbi:bifunctional AP-4-A phosphorylase/ADP sulfurylase [Microbotryomycetes sp. JL201]|nr:bifunctional AP-4-A phosphorylase/ADP sulfurylase [Microbotryomycetes sp. JL201]
MPFENLASKIKAAYKQALDKQHVLFTESDVVDADDAATGIPFEIRFAPALQKKPTDPSTTTEGARPVKDKPDPFAAPYQEGLFVTEDVVREDERDTTGERFAVLLNKFCVTPRHFLLVTKDFAPQTAPLTPLELVATYSILKQLGAREKHLAFFNCGPLSGASQPHKHLQFIPLPNGTAPFDTFIEDNKPSNPRDPFQLPLPYANFTTILSPPQDQQSWPAYFARTFLPLLDLMIEHLRRLAHGDGQTAIKLSSLSYNVIMTLSYMQIVPRMAEDYELPNRERVSVNSLGFAGMLLVKSSSALQAVQEIGVLRVLQGVAYRPVAAGESRDEVKGEGKELAGAVPASTEPPETSP